MLKKKKKSWWYSLLHTVITDIHCYIIVDIQFLTVRSSWGKSVRKMWSCLTTCTPFNLQINTSEQIRINLNNPHYRTSPSVRRLWCLKIQDNVSSVSEQYSVLVNRVDILCTWWGKKYKDIKSNALDLCNFFLIKVHSFCACWRQKPSNLEVFLLGHQRTNQRKSP